MPPRRTDSYNALSPTSKRARTLREKAATDAAEGQLLMNAASGEYHLRLTGSF